MGVATGCGCKEVYTVGVTEKLPLPFSIHRYNSVHCSRKQRSPFSSHPAGWLAGQPFSEQTASDTIGTPFLERQ